jgi:hypothetical protein
MSHPCARCGRQLADGSTVCREEASELARALRTAAGHAEDAEAVLARQTRYGAGASGSGENPLPGDLTAAARLHPIANTITGWTRVVTEQIGRAPRWRPMAGPTCPIGVRCPHLTCAAIRRRTHSGPPLTLQAAWLAQHVDVLRHHPAAGEAFDDLLKACDDLERLVDRPADKNLVGVCDCGRVLYAPHDKVFVTCPQPTCKQTWHVERSRDILRTHLADKLVTLPEAARLAAYLDGDRTQDQIRALISRWVRASLLEQRGEVYGEPTTAEREKAEAEGRDPRPEVLATYRFGDISVRLASTPRRAARRAEEASTAA